MDIKLIHKQSKNNVVPDMLSQKEKYQDEKVVSVTKALRAMFIKESDLNRKLKEGYVNDHLAKHYFDELRQKHKWEVFLLKMECSNGNNLECMCQQASYILKY